MLVARVARLRVARRVRSMMVQRWLEFLLLFVVAPCVLAVVVQRSGYRGAMAPVLWLVSILIAVFLRHDAAFDQAVLWRLPLSHLNP
jgi:uncharacterized membrane protein YoaK (UPF0700 family)